MLVGFSRFLAGLVFPAIGPKALNRFKQLFA